MVSAVLSLSLFLFLPSIVSRKMVHILLSGGNILLPLHSKTLRLAFESKEKIVPLREVLLRRAARWSNSTRFFAQSIGVSENGWVSRQNISNVHWQVKAKSKQLIFKESRERGFFCSSQLMCWRLIFASLVHSIESMREWAFDWSRHYGGRQLAGFVKPVSHICTVAWSLLEIIDCDLSDESQIGSPKFSTWYETSTEQSIPFMHWFLAYYCPVRRKQSSFDAEIIPSLGSNGSLIRRSMGRLFLRLLETREKKGGEKRTNKIRWNSHHNNAKAN